MENEQLLKQCNGCGLMHDASCQGGNYIDYGWSFSYPDLGHYGGFTDNFDLVMDMRDSDSPGAFMVHLCHDCCVKMLDALPFLATNFRVNGCNPNKNDHDSDRGILTPPCCPYAWTWVHDKDEPDYEKSFTLYLATKDLTWEKETQPEE
jgi:hypothetical protein